MRERISYFLRMLADCFESYGSFPVYLAEEGGMLRYFDEEENCFRYNGELLQAGQRVCTAERERFRVVVQTGDCDSCFETVHWLGLEFQKKDGTWKPLLLMHESKLALLQSVLRDVEKYLETNAR